jgi:hypothetical protein
MRLTLRTMLAYMDGILDPADAEELGRKIEESEFATDLLHRTRDVMRRLRLAAPGLGDPQSSLDANSVAEYLDNTLHHEQVPDFEKACLESDVHLAEVASCHQILTLILGEPAEIDPAARQRMYGLPDLLAAPADSQVDSAGVEAGGPVPQAESEPSPPMPPRQKPTVPDYLREPRKRGRFLPVAALLTTVACLAVVILWLAGQLGRDKWPLSLLQGQAASEVAEGSPQDISPRQQSTAAETGTSAQTPSPAAPVVGAPVSEAPPVVAPPMVVPSASPPSAVAPTAEAPAEGLLPPELPRDQPAQQAPAVEAPVPEGPTAAAPPAAAPPAEAPPAAVPPVEPVPVDATAVEPVKAGSAPMGRLVSDQEILLRFDPDSATWQRVPGQGILASHDQLLALPTYRPKITLSAGVVQLLGGTEVELLPSDASGVAGLDVHYGRLLFTPPAEAGTQLRLAFGQRAGVITFADAQSIVAVEVTPVGVPGADPQAQQAPRVARLYATDKGHIVWEERGEQRVVDGGAYLLLDDRPLGMPVAVKDLPEWVGPAPLGSLEKSASSMLEQLLQVGGSTELALREMADHPRKREFRWLGSRCLAHIGEFGPLVAGLNDPENKARWPNWEAYHLPELLAAVARSPQAARQVHEAVERQFGDEADTFCRMLWGYTNQDLIDGQDARLVACLDDKILAVRRLGIWNLRQITGLGLHYDPDQTAAKRKASVQKWNERLKAGEIRVRSAEGGKQPPAEETQLPGDTQPALSG